ncbi:hypothetical protein GQ457_14G018990 [Hibiscus cannabinus]
MVGKNKPSSLEFVCEKVDDRVTGWTKLLLSYGGKLVRKHWYGNFLLFQVPETFLGRSDGNVLKRLDEIEFIDTPLHMAAEQGCLQFAMEMMNLKPSFSRKLNHQGLSPIHLALYKGHTEMVLRFVEIDKQLIRVKGKNGETPLHYITRVGNHNGLLDRFLQACPDSIHDFTTQNRTALHIAVENNRIDVLQVLIRTLLKKDYYREVVNRKDENGNTALHMAASNNQPQVRLDPLC